MKPTKQTKFSWIPHENTNLEFKETSSMFNQWDKDLQRPPLQKQHDDTVKRERHAKGNIIIPDIMLITFYFWIGIYHRVVTKEIEQQKRVLDREGYSS